MLDARLSTMVMMKSPQTCENRSRTFVKCSSQSDFSGRPELLVKSFEQHSLWSMQETFENKAFFKKYFGYYDQQTLKNAFFLLKDKMFKDL